MLQRPEKEDEGGNPYTEGADSSSPAENSTSSKEASSSISRVGRQLASLECTIEESSETDNSNESAEFDESDDLNESEGGQKRKFGPRISIETDSGSVSTSSSSTVGDGGGGNMGERVTGGKNRAGCGRQRGDVETMREPPMVDWEVAVVMSSKNADDMVSCMKADLWVRSGGWNGGIVNSASCSPGTAILQASHILMKDILPLLEGAFGTLVGVALGYKGSYVVANFGCSPGALESSECVFYNCKVNAERQRQVPPDLVQNSI